MTRTFHRSPSVPVVFLEMRGRESGVSETLSLSPLEFKYSASIDKADMIEFTVLDPTYEIIDHPLLQENLQTDVTVRFGYGDNLSPPLELVFYRQRPKFTPNQASTTITCYDKGIFLMLPIKPRVFEAADRAFTVAELVQEVLDSVENLYGVTLTADFDGYEYDNRHFRMSNAFSDSLQFLYWLRNAAIANGGADVAEFPEVWVEGDVLHFHPPRKRRFPQRLYVHRAVDPGARLIEFSPEVNVYPKTVKVASVDPRTGAVDVTVENQQTDGTDASTSLAYAVNGVRASTSTHPVVLTGDATDRSNREISIIQYEVKDDEATLQSVAEAQPFPVNPEELKVLNGFGTSEDDEIVLEPGQKLNIPVPEEINTAVQSIESARQAPALFLAQQNEAANAKAKVLGDPNVVVGRTVEMRNLPNKWRGIWYVKQLDHTIGENGYTMEYTLTRDGFMLRGEGLTETAGDSSIIEQVENTGENAPERQEAARVDGVQATTTLIGDDGEPITQEVPNQRTTPTGANGLPAWRRDPAGGF